MPVFAYRFDYFCMGFDYIFQEFIDIFPKIKEAVGQTNQHNTWGSTSALFPCYLSYNEQMEILLPPVTAFTLTVKRQRSNDLSEMSKGGLVTTIFKVFLTD